MVTRLVGDGSIPSGHSTTGHCAGAASMLAIHPCSRRSLRSGPGKSRGARPAPARVEVDQHGPLPSLRPAGSPGGTEKPDGSCLGLIPTVARNRSRNVVAEPKPTSRPTCSTGCRCVRAAAGRGPAGHILEREVTGHVHQQPVQHGLQRGCVVDGRLVGDELGLPTKASQRHHPDPGGLRGNDGAVVAADQRRGQIEAHHPRQRHHRDASRGRVRRTSAASSGRGRRSSPAC